MSALCTPAPVAQSQAAPIDLCGHTPEQFAEAALGLEPRGALWCKFFATTKAALHRAYGKLLSGFEQRICVLFNEALACQSVELLSEWEIDYGLPGACDVGSYPADMAGRQAQVCAARRASGVKTLAELQALLRTALNCDYLTIEYVNRHSTVGGWTGGVGKPLTYYGGICIKNITATAQARYAHNVVGGWGVNSPGSAVGQPLTVNNPNYVATPNCPIIYHSTVGGWTGGVGQPLMQPDKQRWPLLVCLLQKHLPAHIAWQVCK